MSKFPKTAELIKNVTRDAAGCIVGWGEGGFVFSVGLDTDGRPLGVTGSDGSNTLQTSFNYSGGQFIGLSGDTIPSAMMQSLVAVANGQVVTARRDLLTGGIAFSPATVNRSMVPQISQYDRALVFAAPPRQANAVKGFSRNINDLMYVGAITDAEVYDTEDGALSVGMATSKALAFPWRKMLWDLDAGESLLVQARVKTVGATTSSNVLFGNSDGTVEGFGMVLYGPTHATTPGRLLFNFKGTGTAGQAIVVTPARVSGASVAGLVLPTDTYLSITVHVDGATKRLDVWVNGEQGLNNSAQTLNAGSTINPTPRNVGLGHIPAGSGWTSTAAKAARFQAFRMAVLPEGLRFVDPGLLDFKFSANPRHIFTDADYLGVPA